MTNPILRPGRNCWRTVRARQLAFLVDGEEYFRAVREALLEAQRSIFILGWDIDSRQQLVPVLHLRQLDDGGAARRLLDLFQ